MLHRSVFPSVVCRRLAVLFLFALSLSSLLPAQQAQLEVSLTRPDDDPAAGILLITGSDTTLTDSTFSGTATYVLKDLTAVAAVPRDALQLFPNPAAGRVSLLLPAAGEGVVTVRTLTGQTLALTQAADKALTLHTPGGLLLVTWHDT